MLLTARAIEGILKKVESRRLSSRRAFEKLKNLPYESLSFAKIDHHRQFRKGFPEAVYAPGKTAAQLEKIIRSIQRSGHPLIVTRLEKKTFTVLRRKIKGLCYSEEGRIGYFQKKSVGSPTFRLRSSIASLGEDMAPNGRQEKIREGAINRIATVAVLTGGTSDLPVAEEAALTLELMGLPVVRIYDCGVAGLHRLLDQLPKFEPVKAIICVAGMEGALPSVVAGLVNKPVIAVPTSVGYGASFRGVAPLLTMLNSCAQGVAVVNIDNGFGAACFTASILSAK